MACDDVEVVRAIGELGRFASELQAPEPGSRLAELVHRTLLDTLGVTVAAAGYRFGAVARNLVIADELKARVIAYGHGERFGGTAVLDLSLADIDNAQRWNDVLSRARRECGVYSRRRTQPRQAQFQ